MTPWHSWNFAKFGIKHQSINQSINEYFYMNLRMMRVNFVNCNTLFLGSSWSYGSWIYNFLCNQCISPLIVLDTTLFDQICQWFSHCTPVSSTNKTDHNDVTEILLVTIRKAKPLFLILLKKTAYVSIYEILLHYWLNKHITLSQILIFGLQSSKVITTYEIIFL